MALERISPKSREEWLEVRQRQGIGASEAAAVCGLSPWMTTLELWQYKTGVKQQRDLSDNASVQKGVALEPVIRDFFAAEHPEYSVEHHPYDLLFQSERPWLFATLDGELRDTNGKNGVLEIKTATPNSAQKWNEWKDGVPQHYAIQCLHQLLATGWDFVILKAALFSAKTDDVTIRQYEFYREDHEEDLAYLLRQEERFYQHIVTGTLPHTTITF